MLRCERTTPLGSPVDPEVKITVAMESRFIRGQPGEQPLQQPMAHQVGQARTGQLVDAANLPGNLLEHEQLGGGLHLELVQDLGRGDHVLDAALGDRRVDHLLAGRVIQIDRDLALEHECQVDHGRRNRGRKQHTHVRLVAHRPRQEPAQHGRADQGLAIGQARAGAVAEGRDRTSGRGPHPRTRGRAIARPVEEGEEACSAFPWRRLERTRL